MKESILILGSAGFIGANLIRYIAYNYKDYNIIGIDRLDNQINLHNVYINKCHDFYMADIKSNITDIIIKQHRPSYIINMLPPTSDYSSVTDFSIFLEKLSKFPAKKVIQLTSSDIYKKEKTNDGLDEAAALSYNEKLNVSSIFMEKVAQAYISEHDNCIQYHSIRYDDLFGPRRKDGIVSSLYREIKNANDRNEDVILPHFGACERQLLYIEDLCKAIMLVLSSGTENCYNVSGAEFMDIELFNLMLSYSDLQCGVSSSEEKCNYTNVKLNSSKIRDLGWKPNKFKDSLKYTINWYLNNKWIFNG